MKGIRGRSRACQLRFDHYMHFGVKRLNVKLGCWATAGYDNVITEMGETNLSLAYSFFPHFARQASNRVMIFVDGENFAMSFKRVKGEKPMPEESHYEEDVYYWGARIGLICAIAQVVRIHYYTSVKGDHERLDQVTDALKVAGIEAPRVFKRHKQRGSKRVDITLATEMLGHAHRDNYELAVLIAGDEDYVPLVEAVQREGPQVSVWFFKEAVSPALRRCADSFHDLSHILFEAEPSEIL